MNLGAFLQAFVAEHRGLRMGRLFGRPAAYAGRRVFARITEEGLLVCLPPEGATRGRRGAPGRWSTVRPRTAADIRELTRLLEMSARHVATNH